MVLLLALLLQADPAGEIRELIRTLTSDSPEARERASARLKEIGPPAAKALEDLARTGDAELRGRARDLLDHLARMERLRAFRPSGKKVSIELAEVPMKEAVHRVLDPFGMTGVQVENSAGPRRVTLSIKDAPLWEAVDRLAKVSDLSFDIARGQFWEIASPRASTWGATEARVSLEAWGFASRGKGDLKRALSLNIGLPPDAWACHPSVEDLEVTDATGKKIAHQWEGRLDLLRRPGLPTRSQGAYLEFAPDDLKGVRQITLSGILKLEFPKDVDRRTILRLPGKVSVPGGTIEIERCRRESDGRWDFSVGASSDGATIQALVGIEDEQGRWLGDLANLLHRHSGSSSTGGSATLIEGIPARGVVTLVIGTDLVREKFRLSIDVPSGD